MSIYDRILSLSPDGYWPLSGDVNDHSGHGFNATIIGNIPFQTIDGIQGAYFDGDSANYIEVSQSALSPINVYFTGKETEGTLIAWSKVYNIGTWTDGVYHSINYLSTAGLQNQLMIYKNNTGTRTTARHKTFTTGIKQRINTPFTSIDWFMNAMTWSESLNQMIYYVNNIQIGAAVTPIGKWIEAPSPVLVDFLLGIGLGAWYGWLAHQAWWSRVLTPAEISFIFTEPIPVPARISIPNIYKLPKLATRMRQMLGYDFMNDEIYRKEVEKKEV